MSLQVSIPEKASQVKERNVLRITCPTYARRDNFPPILRNKGQSHAKASQSLDVLPAQSEEAKGAGLDSSRAEPEGPAAHR